MFQNSLPAVTADIRHLRVDNGAPVRLRCHGCAVLQATPSSRSSREDLPRSRNVFAVLSLAGLPLAYRRSASQLALRWKSRVARTAASPRVAVIGAGPAGLSAALALRKEAGIQDVTVFENSPVLKPGIGGGLQLHAGASLLEELGVPLRSIANPLRGIRSRSVDGSSLLQLDLTSLVERFMPFTASLQLPTGELASCTVMRDALLQAMAGALPANSIKLNHSLTELSLCNDEQKVECVFSCGGNESLQQQFDLVVAADGINSSALNLVSGETAQPASRYTGLRIRYGVRRAGGRPAGSESEAHQWFGEGVYALTATYGGLESTTYEMIAIVFRDDNPVSENANWDTAEVREESIAMLQAAGHNDEVLDVARSCDRFFEIGVCERPVGLERWNRGRVVAIGDAAHAMPPFLGQGANQAVQDAVCLARWLQSVDFASGQTSDASLEGALLAFVTQRLPPVAVLSLESTFLGQVETLPGEWGSLVRDNFFRLTGASGVAGLVFLNGALARV